VVGLFIARHRIGRGPLAAVLFFIGTLVPALGFVNVYPMRYSFVADHFQYLASIGLIALIAAALCRLKGPIPPPVISMVVLAPLVVLNVLQQRIYKDQETLWLDTIAQNQTCWMAHVNLASVYQAENRPDEAMRESVLALQLAPNEADTQYNMGVALAKRKQWKDAEWHFREAVKCDPEREYAWSNLARVLWEHVGTPEAQAEALRAAKRALAINPNLADAHYVLARVAEFRGDLQTAIAEYTRALTIAPDDYHTHYNVGVCLLETGRAGEAAGEFQKVLNHDKNDAPAWTDLGYANLDVGRTSDAIACFQRALSIDPGLGPAKEGLKRVTGR
jgi:tetratricopeptide (TPR) repeat protein